MGGREGGGSGREGRRERDDVGAVSGRGGGGRGVCSCGASGCGGGAGGGGGREKRLLEARGVSTASAARGDQGREEHDARKDRGRRAASSAGHESAAMIAEHEHECDGEHEHEHERDGGERDAATASCMAARAVESGAHEEEDASENEQRAAPRTVRRVEGGVKLGGDAAERAKSRDERRQ